jgi:methylase of polypeptide subunit release factors
MRAADRPVYRRRLHGPRRLTTLISLFVLGLEADVGDARDALPLEEAEAEGLLERDGRTVRPLLRVEPVEDLLLVHDPDEDSLTRDDYVINPGRASRTLASLTVRRPVASALDLGTGCGIQALLAARHAERVVGVDINPRALELAHLSARLSGVGNVEWRQGSLYEPVEGERFDLVVANPPFVVSFGSELVFRDAGETGDALSREVVRHTADHLEDGGYATVLCSWLHDPDGDWEAPLRAWVEGIGCDAWLLRDRSYDPLSYAAVWNAGLRATDVRRFEMELDLWLSRYDEHGVGAIATGAIVLRRADGEPRVRADDMRRTPAGSASDQITRVFAASGPALSQTSEGLGGLIPVLVDGQRLERVMRHRGGRLQPRSGRLVLDQGAGVTPMIAPEVVELLLRVDGERTLAELVADTADATGLAPEQLEGAARETLPELFGLGFLDLRRDGHE